MYKVGDLINNVRYGQTYGLIMKIIHGKYTVKGIYDLSKDTGHFYWAQNRMEWCVNEVILYTNSMREDNEI